MPPPTVVAVLTEMMELEMVRVPELLTPPPRLAVLPEMVELEMLRMPELLMPLPPKPIVFDPVTVMPEMVRLPLEAMVKILKLPLLASMVSEEAPSPLMVTVPAVPPVIAVLASMMRGNAVAKTIV